MSCNFAFCFPTDSAALLHHLTKMFTFLTLTGNILDFDKLSNKRQELFTIASTSNSRLVSHHELQVMGMRVPDSVAIFSLSPFKKHMTVASKKPESGLIFPPLSPENICTVSGNNLPKR